MIPSGTRFIGFGPRVDLSERKTANLNSETEPYTLDDIRGYKVFSALLSQEGESEIIDKVGGDTLTLGQTYLIFSNPDNEDLTIFGAPNSDVGTYFLCTYAGILSTATLYYNTGAPVANILENTIGNVWWTYNDQGSYGLFSNSLFGSDILKVPDYENVVCDFGNDAVHYFKTFYNSSNNIELQTRVNPTDTTNGILNNTFVEIRVYN